MNKDALVAAGLDYDDGVRRCSGNVEFYEKLLAMFLDDPNMAEARERLQAKDYDGLFNSVHEIKGMSGNLSITAVYREASKMVELLRAGDNDAATAALSDLEAAYDKASAAISGQLAGE